MCNGTTIEQNASIGSHVEQIGIQNNYNGILPEQATQMAISLFMDNFPKLQEEAKRIARERAEELCKGIIESLSKKGLLDFSAFKDPDIQYVLYEGQKEYARFGTKELYDLLVHILAERICHNDYNDDMKIIFDESVHVAQFLKRPHLNYLSHILFCKHMGKNPQIQNLNDLKTYCEEFAEQYPLPSDIIHSVPLLIMHKILNLHLGSAEECFSRLYNFNQDDIKKLLPPIFKSIHGDYGLSPMGIVLAGLNIQLTEKKEFPIYKWLELYHCSPIDIP